MPRSTPRDPSSVKSAGTYRVVCRDSTGRIRWEETVGNFLLDEGEFGILDIALRGGTAPSSWYIGLFTSDLTVAPTETNTLASLNTAGPYEPTNVQCPGYSARAAVNRDATVNGWSLDLSAGDYEASTKTVSWPAVGDWAKTIRWLFLTTTGTAGDTTGKLFSLAQLLHDRTVYSGDVLDVTYSLKLQ